MKLSAWVSMPNLLPETRDLFEKLFFERLSKHKKKMYMGGELNSIIKSLKNAGVHGMELRVGKNTTDAHIAQLKQIVKVNKFPVNSIHQSLNTSFNITLPEIKKLFEIAQKFSSKVIVIHLAAIGDQIFDKEYVKKIKKMEKKYKIKIGIENNPKMPFKLFKRYTWREKEFSEVLEKTDLHITFDTTHLAQTGADILAFYERHKDRIIDIQLSDYKKNIINTHLMYVTDTHLALGEGTLPIKKLLQKLKRDKYKGIITMEIDTSLEGLCKSAKFIRKNFG